MFNSGRIGLDRLVRSTIVPNHMRSELVKRIAKPPSEQSTADDP